ncbi:MAG TPA: hypothetical protein VMZ50_02070 [Phycisphaerae bacterium]|nr:hypothetical protein [Phycisphaerae bacterium]
MKIAEKRHWTPGGDLHTTESLHRSRTRWFVRTESVLAASDGDEETVDPDEARMFCAEAGDWRFTFGGDVHSETLQPVEFPA